MKNVSLLFFVLVMGFCGCITESHRNSAVAKVANLGSNISSRFQYRITCAYDGDKSQIANANFDFFTSFQPNVFVSKDGILVVLRTKSRMPEFNYDSSVLSFLLSACSFNAIPVTQNQSAIYNCIIEVEGMEHSVSLDLIKMGDWAQSHLLPTPLLCYNDSPKVKGGPVYSQHTKRMTLTWPSTSVMFEQNKGVLGADKEALGHTVVGSLDNGVDFSDGLMQRALAYGVAVKLKELEDSGKIDAMLKKKAADVSTAPKHNIIRLDRDSDKNFSYAFELELVENPADFKKAWQMVLQDFAKFLKEDYVDAFPSADIASLQVSFSGIKRDGLRLNGSAAVLTLKTVSLEYNPHNRKGTMSVRFAEGQVSEASTWIRRNIKTLVRDKNIALTSGSLPPEGKFAITNEKIDGNVMTIEFMVE